MNDQPDKSFYHETRHLSSPNDTAYWLAFQRLGLGFQTVKKLLQHFPNIEALWNATLDELRRSEISQAFIHRFMKERNAIDPFVLQQRLERSGMYVMTISDTRYPLRLRETHSPPLVLYVRGNITLLNSRMLTVVGTRKPTRYGLIAARRLVEPLAAEGVAIVSGLAFGIDAEAHEACLAGAGRAIAVLGNRIDDVYPRSNLGLAQRILERQGAIISEYPPGTESQKHFFPQRNRIMAGLSPATLIVEAGEKSGALITARCALEENREVFAVPGPIDAETSTGPNNLLKMGASPATDPSDFREALGLDRSRVLPENNEIRADSAPEAALLPLLREPRHVDELVTMSTLDTSVVNATLSLLEMKGRVRHLGGMHYVRT